MQLITLVVATLPLCLSGALASPFNPIEKRLAPAGTSCGVVGYDRGHFILNKRQCSLPECAALCVKNTQCRSYGDNYNEALHHHHEDCLHYDFETCDKHRPVHLCEHHCEDLFLDYLSANVYFHHSQDVDLIIPFVYIVVHPGYHHDYSLNHHNRISMSIQQTFRHPIAQEHRERRRYTQQRHPGKAPSRRHHEWP
ncbi:hypothetical protein TI39_contig4275g00004 [Zymoseptoria brevis]|uniref:Apple domain-containing protein n=1 Tax=Zymoseptoria brevis TaxID=1047168 RepID=A0A0F4G8H8_9PEZI|nr:hypothetical protein TI39_contig4275g00004 [Zymoseptoria brevis]